MLINLFREEMFPKGTRIIAAVIRIITMIIRIREIIIIQDRVYQAAQNGQRSNNIAARNVSGINTEMQQLDSGEVKSGILEVMSDGYGFIRCDNYLPGASRTVYVSPALIRKFGLIDSEILL